MIFLNLLIFPFLILSNVFGYAQLLKKILKIKNDSIYENFIFGSLLISLFSYLINFFLPLNIILTNFLFIVFTLIGAIFIFMNLRSFYKYILIVLIYIFLITLYSPSYNDYELYHLPYMEVLRKFKIIFGLSNFDPRYAHTSVFQNISALQFNSLMGFDSYVFYTSILTILFTIYLIEKILITENFIIYIFSIITVIFYIIHGSRYGSLGNDYPTHILGTVSIILFIEFIKDPEKKDYFIFLGIILLSILSKFSMIFFILLPFFLILKSKKIFLGLQKIKIFFLLLLTIMFFTKNIINSSCLIFPIPTLCISTTWSSQDIAFSSPKTISAESSVMVKAYMELDPSYVSNLVKEVKEDLNKEVNQKNIFDSLSDENQQEYLKYLTYKKYLKISNWLPSFIKGDDFKKFLLNVILLVFLFSIILMIFLKKKKVVSYKTNINELLLNNIFIIVFISFNFIFWFFNYPQLRYGQSYVILFCSLPIIFYFQKYFKIINFSFFKNFAKYLIVISLTYAVFSNFERIYNSANAFRDNLVHRTNNIVAIYPPLESRDINFNNVLIKQPINGVCSNLNQLCSVFVDRFIKSNRRIIVNKYNYFSIY